MKNIKEITTQLRNGWVAMDENKRWHWFSKEPTPLGGGNRIRDRISGFWVSRLGSDRANLSCLKCDIEPVENWEQSLIEVIND